MLPLRGRQNINHVANQHATLLDNIARAKTSDIVT